MLFVDSADKAARFIQMCDAYGVPLLYLADVPGFMIGKKVEREGIIRAGAKMISAVSEATVPRVSVIVRKAYGAGLYAMCGPGFAPDACLALPGAQIAVMGPDAAVNAVFYNRIQATPEAERPALVAKLRDEYRADIELELLGSELVVDDIVPPDQLRSELVRRFAYYRARPEDALPAEEARHPAGLTRSAAPRCARLRRCGLGSGRPSPRAPSIHRHAVFAVERRGVDGVGERGLARLVRERVRRAARHVQDRVRSHGPRLGAEPHGSVAAQHHDDEIVRVVAVRDLAIDDPDHVVARVRVAADLADLEVLPRLERVLRRERARAGA